MADDDNSVVQISDYRADRAQVRGDLDALNARWDATNQRITELKADVVRDMGRLHDDMGDLRNDQKVQFFWLLGVVITSWVTIMLAIVFSS